MAKNTEVLIAELENVLAGQVHSLRTVELEMLRLKVKLETYQETLKSINQEIEKTKIRIKEAKNDKVEGGD